MKQLITLITIAVFFLSSCTSTQVNKTANEINKVLTEGGTSKPTAQEVATGLKEALKQGVSKGTDQASQVDGFFKNSLLKILMPPEMEKVDQKLRSLGMNKLMDDFVLSLNRGAEEASKEAKPIFVNAITSMTINDAWNILKGSNDAATVYLKQATQSQLYTAFKPVIESSLQKVNATKYYKDIIDTYNRIPTVQKVNPDLSDYVTNKGIDGLFVLIKQEEANIRTNPAARATEILKKIFTNENMKR
jgi:hypothetical protein